MKVVNRGQPTHKESYEQAVILSCYTKAMLKHNSKKVLDIIAGQKQRNAKAAYMEIHPKSSGTVAAINAHTLLKKPEAQIYLQEHIDRATETVVDLMSTSDKDEIRLRSAQDVLDRSHGKAKQQIEQTTTGVTLVIDLTSALNAPLAAHPD